MQMHAAGDTVPLQSVHGLVVYDPGTGKILLVQNTLVLAGAKGPTVEERSRGALADARKRGMDPSKMAVLDLGEKLLEPGQKYHVDHASRSLKHTPVADDRSSLEVSKKRKK